MATRQSTRTLQEPDDLPPPPYSLNPTDEITLELGPTRPFQPPPQQPRLHRPQRQPQRELSDFARDFYAAEEGPSRPAQHLPPQWPQTQNSIPDDGRPTRTPVPGHPLLNNGKTLVYPAGYECNKCLSVSLQCFLSIHLCQVVTPATNPSTPPIRAVSAGTSIPNLIRVLSSTLLGTTVRPIDRDLSRISDQPQRTPVSVSPDPSLQS